MQNCIKFTFEWPPSVNHYWVIKGRRWFIGKRGLEFRASVKAVVPCGTPTFTGPVRVFIEAYPPDKRRRDLDNTLKATLDAMQHADIYIDDNQVADLQIVRKEVEKPGKIIVTIEEL